VARQDLVTPAHAPAIRALAGEATTQIYDQMQADGAWLPALALAPPAIHPSQRGHGAGTALMHAVLGAADALGEPLAAIAGSPASYYTRFGFWPAAELRIDPPRPDWRPYFLVRPLTAYTPALRGTFRYPGRSPAHKQPGPAGQLAAVLPATPAAGSCPCPRWLATV
jgi:putative acetyltransferase